MPALESEVFGEELHCSNLESPILEESLFEKDITWLKRNGSWSDTLDLYRMAVNVFEKSSPLSENLKKQLFADRSSESTIVQFFESLGARQLPTLNNYMNRYDSLIHRMNDPKNQCSVRCVLTRFNPIKKEFEGVVLGIGNTTGDSDFSKSKAGTVEIPGGKNFEYEKGIGPINKTEVLDQLKTAKGTMQVLTKELTEEVGIESSDLISFKYLKTLERNMQGVWAKDPKVKKKVTDVFVAEIPYYLDVKINNENSDDDHKYSEWIPLTEIREFVDSPSTTEVFDSMSKNINGEVFNILHSGSSEVIINDLRHHFKRLNNLKNLTEEARIKARKSKNPKIKKVLGSFIDFGRTNKVSLKGLKEIFFAALETDQKNLFGQDAERIARNFDESIDYVKNHLDKNKKFSPEFWHVLRSVNITKSVEDFHNFLRGFSKHELFKPQWKDWCLEIFNNTFIDHYAKTSLDYYNHLDAANEEFEQRDWEPLLSSFRIRSTNQRNRQQEYDIYEYLGGVKQADRIKDKYNTKLEFDGQNIKDAARRRIVFKDKEYLKSFERSMLTNLTSLYGLKKERVVSYRQSEVKYIGMAPYTTSEGKKIKIPFEVQLLLEADYPESEGKEKSHKVYATGKSMIAQDRNAELSAANHEMQINDWLTDDDILHGDTPVNVRNLIHKRHAQEFLRMPSISNPNELAYYSKTNLKNTLGKHLREDEDGFLKIFIEIVSTSNNPDILKYFVYNVSKKPSLEMRVKNKFYTTERYNFKSNKSRSFEQKSINKNIKKKWLNEKDRLMNGAIAEKNYQHYYEESFVEFIPEILKRIAPKKRILIHKIISQNIKKRGDIDMHIKNSDV